MPRLKNGKIVLYDGKTYEGEFEWTEYLSAYSITNGTHHFEKNCYEGSFSWSKEKKCYELMNGQAILYKNDKLVFEGRYKNGKQYSGYFSWNSFFKISGEVIHRYKNSEYGDDCWNINGSLNINEDFDIVGTFNLNMDEHNPIYIQKDEIKIIPKSISKYEIKYINGDVFKSEIQDLIITFTEKEKFKITTGLGVLTQGNKNITGHIESNVFKKQSFFDKLLG